MQLTVFNELLPQSPEGGAKNSSRQGVSQQDNGENIFLTKT